MRTMTKDGRAHERAEALDDECLRAMGYPRDPAIRQELLSALEAEGSFDSAQRRDPRDRNA